MKEELRTEKDMADAQHDHQYDSVERIQGTQDGWEYDYDYDYRTDKATAVRTLLWVFNDEMTIDVLASLGEDKAKRYVITRGFS